MGNQINNVFSIFNTISLLMLFYEKAVFLISITYQTIGFGFGLALPRSPKSNSLSGPFGGAKPHQIQSSIKDSFLIALREVAPEMELFLENHGQYIKNFVIKLIYIKSCTFRQFTKKMYLKRHSATFFLRKLSTKHYFRKYYSLSLLRCS